LLPNAVISQRPAVVNKNVLSQVDGLIAFKLTSTQDRDALDAWIEGQADRAEGRAIKDTLPTIVRDATGQELAYVYFEDEPNRQRIMKRLSRDEARRVAANIAKLPDLLRKARPATVRNR
jgi:hypothetical protein